MVARGDLPALSGDGVFDGELIVDRILARREDWSLALCRTPGADPKSVRLAGLLGAGVEGGDRIRVRATWNSHPKYGPGLQATAVERLGVDERGAVAEVLRAVRHIGPSKAEALVEKYGEHAIERIDEEPETAFKKLPGLGAIKARESAQSWKRLAPNRPLHLMLARHRVGWLTARLAKALGPRAIDVIHRDPYSLTSVHGVGVRTADAIARSAGIDPGGPQRARAVLLEVLREAAMRGGHVAMEIEQAREAALGLGLDPPVALPDDLSELADKSLVLQDGLIADGVLWRREIAVAEGLQRIAGARPNPMLKRIDVPDPLLLAGRTLDDEQRAAVVAALEHPLSVATGLPGTGKTVLIEALAELGSKALGEDLVALAAPTGRAARRIEEATGHHARTIHRMLGWVPGQEAERNEADPIEAGLVVIDEASMLSLDVLEVLLEAVATGAHLVFVGDVDQLEPVGAGKPLEDLIESGACPVARLTKIKRQSQKSMIVHAAHAINRGEVPEFDIDALTAKLAAAPADGEPPELERDVFWIERHGPEAIADEIVSLVTERLPGYAKVDPIAGQQVLAPIYRGPAGVTELGRRIKDGLLADAEVLGKTGFCAGEKLIATANNYDAGLVNGQVLRAQRLDGRGGLVVETEEGDSITVPRSSLQTLESAFAMTVHKAQGTEVPVLVMPVTAAHRFLLDRKLLYTGVTRARTLCVLVGERAALAQAAAGTGREARLTRLRELLSAEA